MIMCSLHQLIGFTVITQPKNGISYKMWHCGLGIRVNITFHLGQECA